MESRIPRTVLHTQRKDILPKCRVGDQSVISMVTVSAGQRDFGSPRTEVRSSCEVTSVGTAEPERSVDCFAREEEDAPRSMGPVLVQMAIEDILFNWGAVEASLIRKATLLLLTVPTQVIYFETLLLQ